LAAAKYLQRSSGVAVGDAVNAMYLDLMDILRAPGTSVERDIDLGPADLDDVRFVERIQGRVKAANARRSIVISGHAASSVEMRCSRCLRVFAQPLEMELEASAPVSFFRAAPNTVLSSQKGASSKAEDGSEDEEEVDDETAAIFDAHSVDVLELLRQAAVLAWPIQPLCSPDCSGLPEATRYKGEATDERWSALRALAQSNAEAGGEAAAQVEDESDADWADDVREDELSDDGEEFFDEELLADEASGENQSEESLREPRN
jgi:uncharacterized protein